MPLFNLELPRAISEMAMLGLATPMLSMTPKGDGHPVIVAPGFMAGDSSTGMLRRFLKSRGYDVYGWDLGTNLGPKTSGLDGRHLGRKVMEVSETTGKKTSLIGWSLGGVFARELAKQAPDKVRLVISLGSPISDDRNHTNARRLFEWLNGHEPEPMQGGRFRNLSEAPPVPTTSILTRTDGVVHWRGSVQERGKQTENIEVIASHCGLGVNPAAIYAIADRLAQNEGAWKPFVASGLASAFFPKRKLQ